MALRSDIIEAALTLATMEDVRDAIARNLRESPEWKPILWRIRSQWLVSLILEIQASGQYPYNATVKQEAEARLGFPAQDSEYYHREGDTLSLLVYNAQCFLRSDKARQQEAQETADGWVRPTDEWLRARMGKHVDVLRAEGRGRVDTLPSGAMCVRPARKRTKFYDLDTIKVRDIPNPLKE